MSENTSQRTEPYGRSITIYGYGNTADEIELSALDEARKVFGADLRLEVVRDYPVFPPDAEPHRTRCREEGLAWMANVKILVIESAE